MTPPGVGLLDTSVVVDLDRIHAQLLPQRSMISALTLAELASGPHAATDPAERARRLDRLQRVEAALDALPFGAAAARAYGRVYAATTEVQRKPRGARAVDLMIAAVAMANELPLVTRNPADVEHLTEIGLVVHAI